MIKNITGKNDFIESLRGKKATFILALSNSATANIKGITQAGIPGSIHLTPTLDSEFMCTGEVRSLPSVASTPKGVPTPALISRAIHTLNPFSHIELLDLGLEVKPDIEYFKIHNFGLDASEAININANINAMELFSKATAFGQTYECKDEYIILGESVPSGTTSARATSLALGYDCDKLFSSSFKAVPNNIRDEVVNDALKNINKNEDVFSILSKVSDNMIIFVAGFILGLNNRIPIILAGGTQMASVLLVVNSILRQMNGKIETSNLSLCTTSWVYEDAHSDIKKLIEMLDFELNTYYCDFDFMLSNHPALKLYDEGEAKEGVGAGGCLAYGFLNGLNSEQITRKVEEFLQ